MYVRQLAYPSGRVIFARSEAQAILAGRKTQHRFLASRAAPPLLASIPVSYKERCPALGFDRKGNPVMDVVERCRVQVLHVWPARLEDATVQDARREGYQSRAALLAAWGDVELETMTWVMRFRVDPQQRPRFLSRAVVAGRQSDYVDHPIRGLRGELEAVDDAALDRFTARAREEERKRVETKRGGVALRDLDSQLDAYRAEAKARHIDIRDELRAIRRWSDPTAKRRQLDSIKRKLAPVEAVAAS